MEDEKEDPVLSADSFVRETPWGFDFAHSEIIFVVRFGTDHFRESAQGTGVSFDQRNPFPHDASDVYLPTVGRNRLLNFLSWNQVQGVLVRSAEETPRQGRV